MHEVCLDSHNLLVYVCDEKPVGFLMRLLFVIRLNLQYYSVMYQNSVLQSNAVE